MPRLFKIDTVTGKTWEFESLEVLTNSHTCVDGWSVVNDDVVATFIDFEARRSARQSNSVTSSGTTNLPFH